MARTDNRPMLKVPGKSLANPWAIFYPEQCDRKTTLADRQCGGR
jgi:hypothetical protein